MIKFVATIHDENGAILNAFEIPTSNYSLAHTYASNLATYLYRMDECKLTIKRISN